MGATFSVGSLSAISPGVARALRGAALLDELATINPGFLDWWRAADAPTRQRFYEILTEIVKLLETARTPTR